MDQQEKLNKKSKRFAIGLFGGAALLVTLGAGCSSEQPQVQVQTENGAPVEVTPLPPTSSEPPTEPPVPTPSPTPITTPPPTPKPSAASYKDGVYTAQGEYAYHSGVESVTITLTLKNDLVVDSQFQATPTNMTSARYMDMFSAGYKPMVIGRNIADLQLGNVSGSSLTPNGFNAAVEKIKAQAKA